MKLGKIGFVGLSHLGLNYLAATAAKGFQVIGYDNNDHLVNQIQNYTVDYSEPKLKNSLKLNKNKIFFTGEIKYLKKCELIFISQDVKTNLKNVPNYKNLKNLVNRTIRCINKNTILVILSQSHVGFHRKIKSIDQKRLYYQVETLVFGDALNRALYPERMIVGCSDPKNQINSKYMSYLKAFNSPIMKMNYESAEIAKMSINLLLASSVTTSNLISEVCETNKASWQDIMSVLRSDKRIGKYSYIKPGLGISGGNLERDLFAITYKTKSNNNIKNYFKFIQNYSNSRKNWITAKLKFLKKYKNEKISILGLSYKENTNSTKNSISIKIIKELVGHNKICVYDPVVNYHVNNKNYFQSKSLKYAIKKSNIIIFMVPWKKFHNININKLIKSKKIVIDPHNIYLKKVSKTKMNSKYFSIGNAKA